MKGVTGRNIQNVLFYFRGRNKAKPGNSILIHGASGAVSFINTYLLQ